LGKRATTKWLDAPVTHLRDVRTELVVKIMLREKFGLVLSPFIDSQRKTFDPLIAAINAEKSDSPVNVWRKESANSVARYLTQLER
jgi:PadR family transcriptional regulator AphA